MVKKILDLPTIMVTIVLALLLIYGAVSLVAEAPPDPVSFSEDEQQLDADQWLLLYEQKKKRKKEQEKSSFYRHFEPRKNP